MCRFFACSARVGAVVVLTVVLVVSCVESPESMGAPVRPSVVPSAGLFAGRGVSVGASRSVASRGRVRVSRRVRVVRVARRLRGTPYRWGGVSPRTGVDCSGFTKYSYGRAGVRLPRTAAAQARVGRRVGRRSARRGDLVVFRTSGGRVYHVGVYVGGGWMIDSPHAGDHVRRRRIWSAHVEFRDVFR